MGELVTASVSSREDHGYIMDIGSNTIRGFVPAKTMSKVSILNYVIPSIDTLPRFSLERWRSGRCCGASSQGQRPE